MKALRDFVLGSLAGWLGLWLFANTEGLGIFSLAFWWGGFFVFAKWSDEYLDTSIEITRRKQRGWAAIGGYWIGGLALFAWQFS